MDEIVVTDQEIGKFEQREDGVYLSVYREKRDLFDFEDLRKEIIRKGVVNADFEVIRKIWQDASGESLKIADYFERYDTLKDKYIEVSVADNVMEAYLSLGVPEGIAEITVNDVLYKLYERGVECGIDEKLIDKLLKDGQPVRKAVVARGKPRVDGQDAKIDMKIDIEKSSQPLINEDGTVDFKNINLIKVVDKDQLLAVKTPATPGEVGFTVTNKKLEPRPGEDEPMPRGKNTYLSEDELSLYSSLIGNVFYEDHLLHVENVYVVRGNVDYSTGNISYPGDVIINGDVKADFQVHTEGNIFVRGTVEAAELVSTSGNIEVKKGIIGTQKEKKAKVVADGSVKALFIQEGVVSAGKDVEVGSYILNSVIHAESEVRAMRDRGLIAGSTVFSGSCIRAKTIGSMSDTKTSIKVGKIIKDEVNLKHQDLEEEFSVLAEEDKLLRKRLDFLDLLKKRLPKFPPEKEKELALLLEKIKKLEQIKNDVVQEQEDFNAKFVDQFGKERRIYVLQNLWPGVLIGINEVVRKVEGRQRRVMAELEENQIEFKRVSLKDAAGDGTGQATDIEEDEEGEE
ncbi:MAG: DUF342 domain-containing protein [Candidatus Glassbacteria bacterium]|nr:DUF342 domain-containing protein [Candidatus Glassbacteria bacterium]